MKRTNNFSQIQGISDPCIVLPNKEAFEIQKRESDLVCDLVFAPDKRTGLPSSDISVYLAPNTPVQVREFIKANIFGEGLQRSSMSEDIDDDVIHELVRGSDETLDDYSLRVSAFMHRERDKVQDAFARARNAERSRKVKED